MPRTRWSTRAHVRSLKDALDDFIQRRWNLGFDPSEWGACLKTYRAIDGDKNRYKVRYKVHFKSTLTTDNDFAAHCN